MGAFVEIGRTSVTNTKNVAVSRRGDGLYSLAQVTVVAGDDGKPMNIYYKGAFTLSAEGLLKIRDLINELFDDKGNEKPNTNPMSFQK